MIAVLAALIVPAAALAALPEAESTMDAATVRGAFLQLSPGARPAGMGGAFTAIADDATAGSWNPGGLGRLGSPAVMAMTDLAPFGAGVSYLAGAVPAGPGAVGVSVAALTAGGIDGRDDDGRRMSADAILEVAGSGAYGMALGRVAGRPVWAGVTVEVHRDLDGGMAFGGGAGAVMALGDAVTAGLAVAHLGPPTDGFALPATVRGGLALATSSRWILALDAAMPITSRVTRVGLGGEYWLDPRLALRAGFRRALADQGFGGLEGLGAGLGARLGSFGLDYALESAGDPGWSHRISIAWLPRPKRPMMTVAIPVAAADPKAFYTEASRQYGAGDHAGAAGNLSRLLNADRTHWQGWALLGNVRAAQADPAGAMQAWKESLRLHPDNPGLAAYVAKQSPAPSAASAAGPAYAEAVRLYAARDYRNAWAKSAEALRADSNHWQSWQVLGSCQYALADRAGARQSFEYCLRLNPNNPPVRLLLDSLTTAK